MNEGRAILAAARQLRAEGTPFLCATVVGVRGSSYRRPGARLIATAERRIAGCVSGGCLEKDLLRTSWWRTRSGPVVVRYDSAESDSPEARLGCGGELDVLLERANDARRSDSMTLVERVLAEGSVGALATVYRSEAASLRVGDRCALSGSSFEATTPIDAGLQAACAEARERRSVFSFSGEIAGSRFDALVEAVLPPPHVFVFGAGMDALPVVESALRLGWGATVWEPSARIDSRARFAKTGASLVSGDLEAVERAIARCDRPLSVVMSHDVEHDRAALAMLLRSDARYVGVLGPRHRTATLAHADALADPRVHAPVGLDLGAETPDEIAVAITAEMLAAVRSATASPLRTRTAIHG